MEDDDVNLEVVEGGGPFVGAPRQRLCSEWILVDHLILNVDAFGEFGEFGGGAV